MSFAIGINVGRIGEPSAIAVLEPVPAGSIRKAFCHGSLRSIDSAMVQESPIEVLKMRFVKGEITLEQYKEMLSVLASPAAPLTGTDAPQTSSVTTAAPIPTSSVTPDVPSPTVNPSERSMFTGPIPFVFTAVVCGPLAFIGLVAGNWDYYTYLLGFLFIWAVCMAWINRQK